MTPRKIVSMDEWEAARQELLVVEKAATRAREHEVAIQRMVQAGAVPITWVVLYLVDRTPRARIAARLATRAVHWRMRARPARTTLAGMQWSANAPDEGARVGEMTDGPAQQPPSDDGTAELQRDWARSEAQPAFGEMLAEHGGSIGTAHVWEQQLLAAPTSGV